MRFCGFQPPSQWCFVTGNKTGAPPSTTSPGPKRKPPRVTKRYSRSGANAPSPPGAEALPTLTPHHGLAGNRCQGSPRPSPAWGWVPSHPASSQSKQGVGGGPRGAAAGREHREEKENVRLPVSHGFRHQHSARGPPPRPVSTGRYGNAQPAPPSPLQGLPQTPSFPCGPLAEAHGAARKLCGRGLCGRGRGFPLLPQSIFSGRGLAPVLGAG